MAAWTQRKPPRREGTNGNGRAATPPAREQFLRPFPTLRGFPSRLKASPTGRHLRCKGTRAIEGRSRGPTVPGHSPAPPMKAGGRATLGPANHDPGTSGMVRGKDEDRGRGGHGPCGEGHRALLFRGQQESGRRLPSALPGRGGIGSCKRQHALGPAVTEHAGLGVARRAGRRLQSSAERRIGRHQAADALGGPRPPAVLSRRSGRRAYDLGGFFLFLR